LILFVAAETDYYQTRREPQKNTKQTKKPQNYAKQKLFGGTEFRTHHLYDSGFTRTFGPQLGYTISYLGLHDCRNLHSKLCSIPIRHKMLVVMVAYTHYRLGRNDDMGQARQQRKKLY
jgi:hypothetical protein